MPADILDQLNEARNEAIYDQDNALVQRIDALVSTLQNNASRLDIGREYLNALSRDGQSFDIREFMRFADRMERLPQEIVNSIVQSDRTENIVRNLMRPENMRRFAQISQNMPVQNLTRRGQISFVENASSVGASSDEGRRIFESVVAAFERQGRNFSNAAAEITARLERLSQFEQRRVQLQQHESRMMGEVQRVRGPVPGGWKASETAYRRMEAAKRLHEQGVRTEEVEREADIAMTFQTAADTRGLTRAEKRKVREFQEAYDNAATLEEREKAEKGLKGEMENFGTAKRSITMVDSALLGVDETMERLTDNMRDFCKGTPKGWQAIGFGIAFAAKELSAFVHSMSDAIVNMAELDVQAGKARANLESMFGAKVYDKFRDALDLTRREMIDFSRTAMDAYRANGVEMEKTMLVAGNIKEAFGQLDTSRLQEAVSIMSELTAGQTDALMGAAGVGDDIANLYANLAKSRKAGQAADLLEQGAFGGDPLLESLNDRDKEIIKLQRMANKWLEDIADMGKNMLPMAGPVLLIEKGVSKLVPLVSNAAMWLTAMKFFGGNAMQKGTDAATSALGNAAGNAAGAGAGKYGWKAGAGIAAGLAITAAVAGGIGYFEKKASRKVEEKKETEDRARENAYAMTGLASTGTLTEDLDKIHETALRWAKNGSMIGGGIGTVAGTVAGAYGTFGVGTIAGGAIGGAAGSAAGAAVGGVAGHVYESKKQKELLSGSVLFMENGKINKKAVDSLVVSAAMQKQLVEYAKRSQKERASSLRSIERTQVAIERVTKGMYSSNADANIAAARRSIEMGASVGGTAAGYGMNVASVLKNGADAFAANIGILNAEMARTASDMTIDEEARLQKTRDILNAQADVTQQFVETMLSSIGEYDKIPEVIASSLRNKIDKMHLDFRAGNFGGTSAGNIRLLAEDLGRSVAAMGKVMRQAYREDPQIAAALEALDKNRADLKEAASSGPLPTGFDPEVVKNGRVDERAFKANQIAVRLAEEQRDAMLKGFDELGKAAYDKARAPQDEIQKLAKEFGGMKEEDLTAAKQKEFYERAAEAARSSMLALQEFAETEAGGMVYDSLEKDISGLSKDIEKLERNQNNSIGLKDIQNNLQLLASRKTGLTEYGIKAGKADESVKEITDAIKRAQTVNLAAGAAQNGEVAEARARAKWTEGVMKQMQEMTDKAAQLVEAVVNDPMVKLTTEVKGILETQSGYMLQNNDLSGYLGKTYAAQSRIIGGKLDALSSMDASLKQSRKDFGETVKGISRMPGADKATRKALEDFGEKTLALNRARTRYAATGSESDAMAVRELEASVDALRAAGRGNAAFEKGAQMMETASAAFNKEFMEAEKQRAEINASIAQAFENILQNVDKYRGTMEYRGAEARQGTYEEMASLYGQLNRPGAVRAMTQERLEATREKGQTARKGILENYEQGLKALLKQYEEDPSMTMEQLQQKKALLEEASQKSLVEARKRERDEEIHTITQAYDLRKQELDLIKEGVDIQSDYLQSIGAPFQEILRVEQMRVDLADKNYRNAAENVRMLEKEGVTGVEMEKAKNELQRASAEKMKAAYGAQNTALEKMFGNMLGAFGKVGGIIGPNNLAAKFGLGYTQLQNGTVARGGKNGPGLAGRALAAGSGLGKMETETFGMEKEKDMPVLEKKEIPADIKKKERPKEEEQPPKPQEPEKKDEAEQKEQDKRAESIEDIGDDVEEIKNILQEIARKDEEKQAEKRAESDRVQESARQRRKEKEEKIERSKNAWDEMTGEERASYGKIGAMMSKGEITQEEGKKRRNELMEAAYKRYEEKKASVPQAPSEPPSLGKPETPGPLKQWIPLESVPPEKPETKPAAAEKPESGDLKKPEARKPEEGLEKPAEADLKKPSGQKQLPPAEPPSLSPKTAARTETELSPKQAAALSEPAPRAEQRAASPRRTGPSMVRSGQKTASGEPGGGRREAREYQLVLNPARLEISFNSEMFEKKVVEIIAREVRKGNP